MIEEKDIRKLCGGNSVFARGEELFWEGKVKSIQYERSAKDGREEVRLTAKVKGSGISLYQVSASITEEVSAVNSMSCTCPAFYTYDGICKHCAGVLLQYVARRDGKKLETNSSASHGVMPARSSSHGITELIQHYKVKERRTYQQMGLNGTVSLYPQMCVSYGERYVEFKIGCKKKKYVLKNIRTFVEALEQERYEYYGKELEFYHSLEAFTKESRPMAEFLAVEVNNPSQAGRNYWYYDKGNRYLHITGSNMDAFFKALGQQEFPVRTEYGKEQLWHISGEAYQPSLRIQGQEDGILLEAGEMSCDYGRDYAYVWEEGNIYKIPMEEVYEIRPVWEYLSRKQRGAGFVSKAELPAFCQELLPVLERHFTVRKRQFQEQAYLPPEPEYEVYLDAPDRQAISCEMFVIYDGVKYNILDKPRAIENRNELEELKKRERVGRWFQEIDKEKKQMLLAGDEERMYRFLTEGMEELPALGKVFVSDALKAIQVRPAPSVSVGVSLKGDMLELTLDSEDMPLAELVGILSSYQRKRKFFRLKSGEFLQMEEDGLGVLSRIQDSMAISPKEWEGGLVQLPKYRALYLDSELKEKNGIRASKNRDFKALVRNMKTVEDNDFEAPASLGRVLREYQKQGFMWLKTLHANGFGGILADDMGLGKTLQVIAFLLSEWEQKGGLMAAGQGLGQSACLPGNVRDAGLLERSQSAGLLEKVRKSGLAKPLEPGRLEEAQSMGELEGMQGLGLWKAAQKPGQAGGMEEGGVTFTNFALIVCPASLVYNWKSEIERFAPSLHAVAVAGAAAERKEALQEAARWDVLITSYDLLKRDEAYYKGKVFGYEVIDEAQYIKNHNTKAAKAVKGISAGFKAALTGTPIENRLSELWSIFDYLMPGFLYPYSRFREELEIPIVSEQEAEASVRLQKMIRPFVLRRLKKDVLKDLPDKLEEAVFAQMEGAQGKLYAAHVQRMKMMLDGQTEAEFAAQKIQVLAELTRLRQLCCDPGLVYEDFPGESAKLLVCMDLIKHAIDGGHRVLLFSQFTAMLARIQEKLQSEGIPYFSLTGATDKERRAELVQDFQKGEAPVFCISLKAGGTGLNLTAADIVIHYDPWWNVAVQNQATDRAHRIGQKNVVTVYKLIVKGTVEENILKLQEKKKELADQLLGNEGFEGVKITKEEMLRLLEAM